MITGDTIVIKHGTKEYAYTLTNDDFIVQNYEPCTFAEHLTYLISIGKAYPKPIENNLSKQPISPTNNSAKG